MAKRSRDEKFFYRAWVQFPRNVLTTEWVGLKGASTSPCPRAGPNIAAYFRDLAKRT
jgi:hypothetical protein